MSQGKKGLPTLAWVAIGCGGLLIVAAIAVSAGVWFVGKKVKDVAQDFENRPVEMTAKTIALANPEIEFVSADEAKKTVVFRNEKTGEEMTFDFEDVKDGKIRFQSGEEKVEYSVSESTAEGEGGITIRSNEGEVKIGAGGGAENLPPWVPVYPGSEVQIGYSSTGDQGSAGVASLKSSDSPEKVLDYYEEKLKEEGFEVQRQTFSGGGSSAGTVTGNDKGAGRMVNVSVRLDGDATEAALNYSGK